MEGVMGYFVAVGDGEGLQVVGVVDGFEEEVIGEVK